MFIIIVIFGKLCFYLIIYLYEFKFVDVNNIYEFGVIKCFCFC